MNKITKNKLVVEGLLKILLRNRCTGYTSKLLEIVENTNNSLLVCAVGDKQKIGPRNDKIVSISNVSGNCMGITDHSLFIDNHCMVDILQKVLDLYDDLGATFEANGYMTDEDVDILLHEGFLAHKQEMNKITEELIKSKNSIDALTAEIADLEKTITNMLK